MRLLFQTSAGWRFRFGVGAPCSSLLEITRPGSSYLSASIYSSYWALKLTGHLGGGMTHGEDYLFIIRTKKLFLLDVLKGIVFNEIS